jgi:class 3 adenylate cyclase
MAHTWNYVRALEHIKKKIKDVETVNIVAYTRDVSLENIPTNKAYRLDGVHIYADILNLSDMLNVTQEEGETCHKRTLRFLNLHYRAVHRILKECDAIRVDFHNQRLHAVVAKPYNTEQDAKKKRIQRAVAISQLIIDVLAETGDDDEHIPNAKLRIGIDSGEALAVNNGRNGGREPLFLGDPANHAAKIAGAGKTQGIFLTNNARKASGLKEAEEPKTTPLTTEEIQSCQEQANLAVSKDTIVTEWRKDLNDNPIGSFEFSRHTPPLRTMDIASLSPANSRRQEAISIYADIDGFTAYVSRHSKDSAEDVVRVFHVIRSELDRVLMTEFEGRRIRFIGDCVHGLICEGTARTTDEEETVSSATLCSGGLRSSFELSLETLSAEDIDTDGLGLAIGFELGPMNVTRLGMQGDRIRCSVSRGVLGSEKEQTRCNGRETAIGQTAYDAATEAVQSLFGSTRKAADLDYNEVVEALSEKGDDSAKESKAAAFATAAPAIAKSANLVINPHTRAE